MKLQKRQFSISLLLLAIILASISNSRAVTVNNTQQEENYVEKHSQSGSRASSKFSDSAQHSSQQQISSPFSKAKLNNQANSKYPFGLFSQTTSQTPIQDILKESRKFDQLIYDKLLTHKEGKGDRPAQTCLLHSDIQELIQQMQKEFPEIISLSSIGKTYENRDIMMVTLDAREFIVQKQMTEISKTITKHEHIDLHQKGYQLTQTDVQSQIQNELKEHYGDKPSILLTGQHHSREHITATVVLFSLLKLLHGGLIWRDQMFVNLLVQNKYYVIPSVNVDGVAFIENEYLKTGVLPEKRKNMDIQSDKCKKMQAGVDLNRNYEFKWGVGDYANDKECQGQTFGGKAPFSEPETQAIRNLVTSKKDELKFVYNLHCSGNQYIIPFNSDNPNSVDIVQPDTLQLFQEIVNEAEFPSDFMIGPASETLGMKAGGSSGDWINWNFHIPASEVEIGTWDEIPPTSWMPVTNQISYKVAMESWGWLLHTFKKVGNQISIKPIGYKFEDPVPQQGKGQEHTFIELDQESNESSDANKTSTTAIPKNKNSSLALAQMSESRKRDDSQPYNTRRRAKLFIEVENHGTAGQIHSDELLLINNVKYEIQKDKTNSQYAPDDFMAMQREIKTYNSLVQQGKDPMRDHERNQHYYMNGIKPRSKQVIEVPIVLEDPFQEKGFYLTYQGHLETNIKYKEFFAQGNNFKNQIMNFPLIQ